MPNIRSHMPIVIIGLMRARSFEADLWSRVGIQFGSDFRVSAVVILCQAWVLSRAINTSRTRMLDRHHRADLCL